MTHPPGLQPDNVETNFRSYATFPIERIHEEYLNCCSEIAKTNIELSDAMQQEHRDRYNAFRNSIENSISARDKEATILTIELTTEIIKLRGEILALKEEKTILEFLIGCHNGRA